MSSPFAQWNSYQRLPIQPKKVEHHKRDRYVCRRTREQIFTVALAAEPPLQVEEREPPTFLKSNDFTVDDQFLVQVPRLICQFWKLTGNAPQIAGENFNSLCTAMKLRADSIKFILQINWGHG